MVDYVQEKLPWSEEVLISKAELEERRSHVAELEQQVAELTMQTEYQLRLKDLHVQVGEVHCAAAMLPGLTGVDLCWQQCHHLPPARQTCMHDSKYRPGWLGLGWCAAGACCMR